MGVAAVQIALLLGGNWPPVTPSELGLRALVGAGVGAMVTVAIGVGVAVAPPGRSLTHRSVSRAAVIGAISGCVVPAGVLLLVTGRTVPVFALPAAVALTSVFGATRGGGLVPMAKRGERGHLGSGTQKGSLPKE